MVKKYHDKKLLKKDFQLGQQVLLFNSKDPRRTWVVNGQRLKQYHGGAMERLNTILHFNPR